MKKVDSATVPTFPPWQAVLSGTLHLPSSSFGSFANIQRTHFSGHILKDREGKPPLECVHGGRERRLLGAQGRCWLVDVGLTRGPQPRTGRPGAAPASSSEFQLFAALCPQRPCRRHSAQKQKNDTGARERSQGRFRLLFTVTRTHTRTHTPRTLGLPDPGSCSSALQGASVP